MFENKFDQCVDEVADENGLNWNDDSKVRLFARFLKSKHPQLFNEWEKFLCEQADEELTA